MNWSGKQYDVVIAGAGPAGATAALYVAKAGLSVLLLERDAQIGKPVRCAEAVEKELFEDILGSPPNPAWICAQINKFRIFSPNGRAVEVNIGGSGYVLDRELFDAELAERAAAAGAVVVKLADVTGVNTDASGIRRVLVDFKNDIFEIPAKIVIAADGVESRVARWAGLDSLVPVKEMESFAQYKLKNIKCRAQTCDFYFSNELSPKGYAWVFPKGEGIANVGLGICGAFCKQESALQKLDHFVAKFFPGAQIVSRTVGGTPSRATMKNIVADGLMVIGDAAHQVNPISFGGIVSGMFAGKIAGEVAAAAIAGGDWSAVAMAEYPRRWEKRFGKKHRWYAKAKNVIYSFNDEQLNLLAEKFNRLPARRQNLQHIFTLALWHNPKLVWGLVRVIWSLR